MKKLIATILALSVVFAFASCDNTPADASSQTPASSQKPPVSSQAPSVETPSINDSSIEEESKNLALKGTAIANGVRDNNETQYGMPHMNDGNTLTLWQAATREEGLKESEEDPSWFGITWEEAQTFDTLFVLWEQAHPTPDGFRVEISDDGETWTNVEFESVRGGTPNETLEGGLDTDKQTDDIVFAEAVTTKYVRVVCFTYYTMPENAPEYGGDAKFPTGVYEFEIYNSADLETEGEGEASDVTSEDTVTE